MTCNLSKQLSLLLLPRRIAVSARNKTQLPCLIACQDGYSTADITYVWADGKDKSVTVLDMQLPQFRVADHKTDSVIARTSTGAYVSACTTSTGAGSRWYIVLVVRFSAGTRSRS